MTGYAPSATRHHEWRTAENSATHLLPVLKQLTTTAAAANNPSPTTIRLLDVGAGSGTITASLARYLIPHGRVVALDISEEILAKAVRHAEEVLGPEGKGVVEARNGSVYELPFGDGEFDVVHASQVLVHLEDPVKAIAEMVRVVKKAGGVVALRESDLRAWSVYPEYEGLWEMNRMLCAVHDANAKDGKGKGSAGAGQRLVSWAMEAGVDREKISAGAGTWCYSTREEREVWGGAMADRCKNGQMPKKAVELGIVTKEQLETMVTAWKRWVEAEDGWFGCMHGEVIIRT